MPRRTINLTFHGIGDLVRPLEPGEDRVWVSRERFRTLLDAVAKRPEVRVTFDDGNASDVEVALPALRERGLHATFFLVAGRLGTPGFVDGEGLRALAGAGMDIGSHGMHHRPWRRLDDRALHEELLDARRRLEDVLGRPVTQAACPFGAYDRRTLRLLRRCGYREVYTSDRGTAAPDGWIQARNTVLRDDTGDILERALASESTWHEAALRATKLAVKRWR